MSKFVDEVWFEIEECCNCGMPFAMTTDFKNRRLKDHKSFYCPMGHGQHYTGWTEEQNLRRQLSREREKASQAETGRHMAEQRAQSISRNYTRMRKRVANGVCPCCNRSFENLRRHIETKHPDFKSNNLLKSLRDSFGLSQAALADEIGINANHVSQYEREKPIAAWAKGCIESWISEQ